VFQHNKVPVVEKILSVITPHVTTVKKLPVESVGDLLSCKVKVSFIWADNDNIFRKKYFMPCSKKSLK